MVRCRALFAAFLLFSVSGCLGLGSNTSVSLFQRFRKQPEPTVPDRVHLDIALVQIPLGDSALHRDLWNFLDEQVVALEKKGLLEQNGFRLARAGSNAPQELLDLVTNRRYCPDPRQVQMPPGKGERVLDLGPVGKDVTFDLYQGEQASHIEIDGGQYALAVTPTLTDDGMTRLRFEPRVKHTKGSRLPWKPSADRSGWTAQFDRPTETYTSLEWEVTLAPGEYLILGPREDRPRTFGHESLVRRDERLPVQRLLVLRAWRPAMSSETTKNPSDDDHAEPLALQAARAIPRGISP